MAKTKTTRKELVLVVDSEGALAFSWKRMRTPLLASVLGLATLAFALLKFVDPTAGAIVALAGLTPIWFIFFKKYQFVEPGFVVLYANTLKVDKKGAKWHNFAIETGHLFLYPWEKSSLEDPEIGPIDVRLKEISTKALVFNINQVAMKADFYITYAVTDPLTWANMGKSEREKIGTRVGEEVVQGLTEILNEPIITTETDPNTNVTTSTSTRLTPKDVLDDSSMAINLLLTKFGLDDDTTNDCPQLENTAVAIQEINITGNLGYLNPELQKTAESPALRIQAMINCGFADKDGKPFKKRLTDREERLLQKEIDNILVASGKKTGNIETFEIDQEVAAVIGSDGFKAMLTRGGSQNRGNGGGANNQNPPQNQGQGSKRNRGKGKGKP